jgi:hypothetical protein
VSVSVPGALADRDVFAECAAVWKAANTWNLSYQEFVEYSYRHGPDGKGAVDGIRDKPGDTVYTTEQGQELTRAMAQHWCLHWQLYSQGFVAAWRLCLTAEIARDAQGASCSTSNKGEMK